MSTGQRGAVEVLRRADPIAAAQQLLRSVGQRPRLARLPSWPELIPELDLAAAQEAWRFEFGWSANDSVVDTVRGLAGRRLDVRGATDVPEHLPLPVEVGVRTEPLDG